MKRFFVILMALCLSTGAFAEEKEGTLTKMGQQVPAFSVKSLSGDVIDISKLRGKVVLINFFATWCGPCMKELPQVEKQLWPRFKNKNFTMVSIGREHTREQLLKFNSKKGFTFPIAADPKREVYSKFADKYIPRNVIVDKNGKIIYQGAGFSQQELDEMINLIEKNL
ncbi:MAG: TlpA family protein disulfide reductase [Marinifilaceae bacterium]